MKDIDTKRPRRLDLNAPLLSTRRPNLISTTSIELSRTGSLRGSSNRVPFSWEQSPGKPKDAIRKENGGEGNKVLPLPKPPHFRWQEDEPTLTNHNDDNGDCGESNDENDYSNNNNDDNGSLSDAIDLLSLAESLNTSERLDFESEINGDRNGSLSPNFMIQRFLPAATALAASSLSALAANKDLSGGDDNSTSNKNIMGVYSSSNHFREGSCVPRVGGETYSSHKGCGFQIFFPWRAKHRLCGVKSPVRRVRSNMKPQLSTRTK